MNPKIKRNQKGPDGIFSSMSCGDEDFATVEHAFQQADGSWEPAIPPGVYPCIRRLSPEFGYDVFLLQNVPGHDMVEIHRGNFNSNSKACVCVGMAKVGNMVTDSKNAFEKFMAMQEGLDTIQLTVE